MNKKIILVFSLIFSVFLFSACNKVTKNSKTETNNVKTNTAQKESNSKQIAEKTQDKNGIFSGTMKDLLGLGKDQKCTFKDQDGNISNIYTSGDKYRSDIAINSGGDLQKFHTISDEEYDYTWQGKKGTKMKHLKFDDDDNFIEKTPEKEQGFDVQDKQKQDFLDKKETFNCSNWKVDQSLFKVPTDVEFTDMSKMMQNAADKFKGVCDSLSGAQKTECLEGMEKMGNFGK